MVGRRGPLSERGDTASCFVLFLIGPHLIPVADRKRRSTFGLHL